MTTRKISEKELQLETGKMAYLFGLLHYHYAKNIVEELGEERGKELIVKAIKAFAIDRGQKMRRRAIELGLQPIIKNMDKVNDLPAYTFLRDDNGNTICPFADAWEEKGTLGQELGLVYCNVNDPWKIKSYDPDSKLWKYITNRNLGDLVCDMTNVEYLE